MELTGYLSDFSLPNILQILSLSCKTCTVILRGEQGRRGMLVFIRGKIVQATTNNIIYSLGEVFVAEGMITQKDLDKAVALQMQMPKPRLLGAILIDMGLVKQEQLLGAVKQHIQTSIIELLRWQQGSFEVKLNAIPIARGIPYIAQDYVYTQGLNIEELLLEAARIIDEAEHGKLIEGCATAAGKAAEKATLEPNPLQDLDEFLEPPSSEIDVSSTAEAAILHLKDLLLELRQQSFQGEISLLVMRMASEICSRGVLFLVKEKEFTGLGQFGLSESAAAPDQKVRSISVPIGPPSILNTVVKTQKTHIAPINVETYDSEIVERIGGKDLNLTAFCIPIIIEGKVRVILYGDNYPGDRSISSLNELEILIGHAGLMMEKSLLERRLQELGKQK